MGRGVLKNESAFRQRPRAVGKIQLKPISKLSAKEIKRCSELTLEDGGMLNQLNNLLDKNQDRKPYGTGLSFVVLAYDVNEIVAWALVSVQSSAKGNPLNAYLELFVDPACRQQGWGSKLVARVLREKGKRFRGKPRVTAHDKTSQLFFTNFPELKLDHLQEYSHELGKTIDQNFC